MLDGKADPSIAASGRNGVTPLIAAVREKREDAVDALLAAGAAVDARVANGWTTLIFAADNKFASVAEKLMDKGADPNLADKEGIPPLIYAVRIGSTDIARLLLERGAEINVTLRFKKENVPLRQIVAMGKNEEMKVLFSAAVK